MIKYMINPCNGCKATCCKNYVITVTSFYVIEIAQKTNRNYLEFAELYPARLLNYDWDTVLQCYNATDQAKLPTYHLLAIKSHPCFFLKNNWCSIHDFAPFICRQYPYTLSGKELMKRHCSFLSHCIFYLKGPTDSKYALRIPAYKKIVKEWNSKKGDKTECMEFLIKKSYELVNKLVLNNNYFQKSV